MTSHVSSVNREKKNARFFFWLLFHGNSCSFAHPIWSAQLMQPQEFNSFGWDFNCIKNESRTIVSQCLRCPNVHVYCLSWQATNPNTFNVWSIFFFTKYITQSQNWQCYINLDIFWNWNQNASYKSNCSISKREKFRFFKRFFVLIFKKSSKI